MVAIRPPPPTRAPDPLFETVPAGSRLVRIFDPTDHGATALGFRYAGPFKRFDHHRSSSTAAPIDPARGIYYAAYDFDGCLVEVFGDTDVIECGERHVAHLAVTRALRLLDLRGNGSWRAGSVAALSQNADYGPSQEWSRYFYDNPDIYSSIDGVLYSNAHNSAASLALYERARGGLGCSADDIIRLDDPALRPALLDAALRLRLIPPT